jgi:hypothetical protein
MIAKITGHPKEENDRHTHTPYAHPANSHLHLFVRVVEVPLSSYLHTRSIHTRIFIQQQLCLFVFGFLFLFSFSFSHTGHWVFNPVSSESSLLLLWYLWPRNSKVRLLRELGILLFRSPRILWC